MKEFHIKITTLLILATIFAACSGGGSSEVKTKEELAAEKTKDSLALKVGVVKSIDCLPALYAQDEGMYDSLGVDVRLINFTSLLDCEKQLQKGNIDGAFIDTKRIEFLKGHRALEMKSVLNTNMQWQLLANRKSRIKKPGQLIDKLVAVTRHSALDYLTDRMLDSVKTSKDKVFMVQVNDVDLRLKMLISGEIDAAWLPEPQASEAKRRTCNLLAQSNGKDKELSVLSFTAKAIADKRKEQQIKAFVEAYKAADKKVHEASGEQYGQLTTKYFGYSTNKVGSK
jgi:NitT/TauT family transport system substrate-binding protein